MTNANADDGSTLPTAVRDAGLCLSDGGLLVYDPRNHTAWVRSDAPVDLEGRR